MIDNRKETQVAREQATIVNKRGLTARAAALLAQTANRYESDIQLELGTRRVDAKNLVGVMLLGVRPGSTIAIEASGADADKAMRSMLELVQSKFGERS
jgi:phosphocarrier protein